MASAVRKLTGVGGDIRKIARLLQKEAPPGHMLAYINQEEADLLKARGGSGEPHADTGVPSFEEEFYTEQTAAAPQTEPVAAPAPEVATPQYPGQYGVSPDVQSQADSSPSVTANVQPNNTAAPFVSLGSTYSGAQLDPAYTSGGFGLTAPPASAYQPVDAAGYAGTDRTLGTAKIPTTTGDKAPADDSFFSNMSDKTKARLGIGGAQAVLGAYQISQATDQAKKYREDMAKLAQPYQAEGKKLIAQAQSGELTPAAQQQLQAAQAQAAQGAQARGGVGAQQAMMAVENMRQQLLQNQYDYGLKVSGIGDQIASGAIKAGMQADQYANSLASSYANNIARTLSNAPTYVTSYSQQNQ